MADSVTTDYRIDLMAQETSLAPAYISFCGAFIGSAIPAIVNWWIARKREFTEEKREENLNAIKFKQAARLIYVELSTSHIVVSVCLENKWNYIPIGWIEMDSWKIYKDVLATTLPYRHWTFVSLAFSYVAGLMSDNRADSPLSAVMGDPTWMVSPILFHIENAMEALGPHAGIRTPST